VRSQVHYFPDRKKGNRPQFRISERRAVIGSKLDFLFLLCGLFSLYGLGLGEALLEFVHAAGGVHELLLAGVKRVADVADADDDGGFGGTRLDNVAAGATDFRIRIFWMNVRLHKRGGKLTRNRRMTRRIFLGRLAPMRRRTGGKIQQQRKTDKIIAAYTVVLEWCTLEWCTQEELNL
jgi:hypothetical protein